MTHPSKALQRLLAALLVAAVAGCAQAPAKKPAPEKPVPKKTEEAPPPPKPAKKPEKPEKAEKPEEPAAPVPRVEPEPAPPPKPHPEAARKAAQELKWGKNNYEDGDYDSAAKNFQNALNTGLASKDEQAAAHKYLAFIYCASERKPPCQSEFRKALQANPRLELSAAEAGHPVWGPVFREVKAEMARKPTTPVK